MKLSSLSLPVPKSASLSPAMSTPTIALPQSAASSTAHIASSQSSPSLCGLSSLFEVAQECFTRHHINRVVPIESLVGLQIATSSERRRSWDHESLCGFSAIVSEARKKVSRMCAVTKPSAATIARTDSKGCSKIHHPASKDVCRTA